jgi:hypothetical protein
MNSSLMRRIKMIEERSTAWLNPPAPRKIILLGQPRPDAPAAVWEAHRKELAAAERDKVDVILLVGIKPRPAAPIEPGQ